MFFIDVEIRSSSHHGVGLFTKQKIKKGEIIFRETPELVINLDSDNFSKLSKEDREMFLHYGHFDKQQNLYVLPAEDVRYINHSANGNVSLCKNEIILTANRDIDVDEEILHNYLEFESIDDFNKRGIK